MEKKPGKKEENNLEQKDQETESDEKKIKEKDNSANIKVYIKTATPQRKIQQSLISLLKLIAPGTKLREAMDDIVRSGNGALIVLDSPNIMKIIEGGFKVNCRFAAQRLVELCKMDGAIVLSQDMDRILYANTLLAPDIAIPTQETGTRHKAAQRTAKQFNTIAIAVSERRGTVTIYYGNLRYVLSDSAEILRRTMESLQILEKQCEVFDDLIINLNILEFTNTGTLNDISEVIQRAEIIQKITTVLNRHIAELGKEGTLIIMRLKQLIKGIEREEFFVIKDYSRLKPKKTQTLLSILSFEELLDIRNIHTALGYKEEDKAESRGCRIIKKLKLDEKDSNKILKEYSNLNQLLESPMQKLSKIIKSESKAKKIQKDLASMKEQALLEKKI